METIIKMKYFVSILLIFVWAGAFAQIDKSDKGNTGERHIGREKPDMPREGSFKAEGRLDKGFSKSSKKKSLIGEPDKLSLDVDDDDDKVDMQKKSDFITRETKFNPDYLQRNQQKEGKQMGHTTPQDLGRYSTSGDYVTVYWRDSQVVDGDRVDIIVNDEVVVHNVTLLAQYHSIRVDLDEGFTKIEFKALNQGESGPNTADFKVETQDGKVLIQDQWNLTTGVKAHLVVVKN